MKPPTGLMQPGEVWRHRAAVPAVGMAVMGSLGCPHGPLLPFPTLSSSSCRKWVGRGGFDWEVTRSQAPGVEGSIAPWGDLLPRYPSNISPIPFFFHLILLPTRPLHAAGQQ